MSEQPISWARVENPCRGRTERGSVERLRTGPRGLAVGLTAAVILVCAATACRDAPDDGGEADRSKDRGAALFVEHCSDCHGVDARGSGPIAKGLTSVPTDLTLISQRRGGVFPKAELHRMVDGRSDFVGHRDVEMPLWGDFFEDDPEAKIAALVAYLESIQRVEPSATDGDTSSTGRDLFVGYCASCHGERGSGDGPVASSLKKPPADLTTLAQRAGGRFDDHAVMSVIDGRREVAAHGPREMPVWGVAFAREHAAAGERQAVQTSFLLTRILTDHVASLQKK